MRPSRALVAVALALGLACGPTAEPVSVHTVPPPPPGPVPMVGLSRTTEQPSPPPRLAECEDLPEGRDAEAGACGADEVACVQTPLDASLRGRDLTLIRCFDRRGDELVDTGARLMMIKDALVMMMADPSADRVACFFSSPTEWATFPPRAEEAAYEWAACTERTTADPFGR